MRRSHARSGRVKRYSERVTGVNVQNDAVYVVLSKSAPIRIPWNRPDLKPTAQKLVARVPKKRKPVKRGKRTAKRTVRVRKGRK